VLTSPLARRLYGRELPALISVETHGHVAVVQMAHGKANALDTTLCRELTAQLAGLERSGHRAAVLTAQGPIFSASVDLLRLRDGGPGYLQEFLPALSEASLAVFTCSVPVVAAVNGHAVAGGCILVCACDHRVMNAGHGRIGVSELLVGLPFPVTALEILPGPVTEVTCEPTMVRRTPGSDANACQSRTGRAALRGEIPREIPRTRSRGRAADKRSKGPDRLLAIRPLTCTYW